MLAKDNKQTTTYLVIAGLFIIFGLARFLFLSADPPPHFGLGFISDEGWWTHNPRNAALFGPWIRDEFNQALVISPAYSLLCFLSFKGLGVSLYSARLPSALAGFASLLVIFLWSRRYLKRVNNRWGAVITTLFLGSHSFYLAFNRVALVDTLMVFFVLGAFCLWDRESTRSAVLSACCMFAAFLAKPFALFLYAVFPLVWLWERKVGPWNVKRIAAFIASSGLAALIWLVLMQPDLFRQFLELNLRFSADNLASSPYKILVGLKSFFFRFEDGQLLHSRFHAQSIILLVLLSWLFLGFITRIRAQGLVSCVSKLERWQVMNGLWVLLGMFIFMPNPYKPEQRFLFLVPPMVALVSAVIAGWMSDTEREKASLSQLLPRDRVSLIQTFIFLFVPVPLVLYGLPLLDHGVRHFFLPAADIIRVGVLLVVLYVVILIPFLLVLRKSDVLYPRLKLFGRAIIIIYLIFHGFFWVDWLHHLSWTMRDTSRDLRHYFTSESVVLGPVAPTLCLENKASAFVSFQVNERVVFNRDPLTLFQPDYYLTIHQIENKAFPDTFIRDHQSRMLLLKRIPLLPDRQDQPRVIIDLYTLSPQSPENH